jgi:hypothetical protein
MTYEFYEGFVEGIDDVQPIWLDVINCGTSEIRPPPNKKSFSVAGDWIPDFSGDIIMAGGHVHDGGTNLKLSLDGKELCDSKASYEPPKRLTSQVDSRTGTSGKFEHVRAMSGCFGDTERPTKIKAGQHWRIEGLYDFEKHKPSAHGEDNDTIMGISLMYIRGRGPREF